MAGPTRSVLNNYTPLTIIMVVVGGSVLLSLLAVLAVRQLFPNLAGGHFEDMADGLRTIYELVFALILAFVIASVLDTYSSADSTVASEAADLAHMKRASQGLPVERQILLDKGLSQYIHAIADEEWGTMKDGKESLRASAALQTLNAVYQAYSPAPPAHSPEAEFYSQAVGQLKDVASTRRSRLALSSQELPSLLRLFLPLGGVLLLALEYRPRMGLRAQLVHMGLLAGVVSFSCLLTVLLDYPFSGDVSVSNEPFKTGALAEYWADTSPHVLAKGEKKKELTPAELEGVWDSAAFGLIIFRPVGGGVRGVARVGQGTFVGQLTPEGTLRGWWCDAPTRQPPDDAGEVEWKLLASPSGEMAYGAWRYGAEGPLKGGWDLTKIGGPEPPDMSPRFDNASGFCTHP